jgi:thiamine biosynthesis protein ThiS
MKITLNNNNEEFENASQLSVSELLALKNFVFKMLIVKINDKIIKKDEYDKDIISEGDNVMVIHLISGG